MKLNADARIPFPPKVVFAACRDDMPKLRPFLPDVRSIEVTSRVERGPVVENVVVWRGGGEVFGPVRAVLSEAIFSWTDYGTWNADAMRVDWRTETHAFTEAVRCGGSDRFLQDGLGQTLLEIRGELEVDAHKLSGVPGLLAAGVARRMEGYLVGKIQSAMTLTAKALASYLEERK
jgi:hypothetical protein